MAVMAIAAVGAMAGGALIPAGILGVSGAAIGWAAGSYIGNAFFGPDLPDTQGPRLSDLSTSAAVEGSDIPKAYGQARLSATPIFSPPLVEVLNTEEVGSKGIGGGGSHTTPTYFCTQLLSVGHVPPGTKLRRVWANKKLVYDASANADAVSAGYRIVWYDGSQTEPDPVYESHVGAGNASAYKGQGLLLMDGWNVTNEFSSRTPMVEVEVCANGTSAVVADTVVLGASANNMEWQWWTHRETLLFSLTYSAGHGLIAEVEPSTGVVIKLLDYEGPMMRPFSAAGEAGANRYLMVFDDYRDIGRVFDMDDWVLVTEWVTVSNANHTIIDENDFFVLTTQTSGAGRLFKVFDKSTFSVTTANISPPVGYSPDDFGINTADGFLIPMTRDTDGRVSFARLYSDGTGWSWSTPITPPELDGYSVSRPTAIVDESGLIWWAIDALGAGPAPHLLSTDNDGNVVDLLGIENDLSGGSGSWGAGAGLPQLHYSQTEDAFFFNYYGVIRRFDCARKTLELFPAGTEGSWCAYHPQTQTCWNGHHSDAGNAVTYKVRLRVVEPVALPVDTIITDIAADAGLDTSADLNLSALSPMPTVAGFTRARQMSARAALQPLLQQMLAEAVVSDWQLKVVPLGGAEVATIPAGDLGARSDTEQPAPPIDVTEPESIALPGRFQLRYPSTDRDLQPAMVTSHFGAAGSGKTVSLEMPIAMSDAEATQLCQKLHQLACEQVQLRFNLPRKYAQLEPTDPILVPTPAGDTVRARLTSRDRGANGVLACQAVTDLVSHLTADAVTGGNGMTAATILSSSPAELIILDGPLLRDTDADHPGPYLAAFTYGAGYPGVVLNSSADGQVYTPFASLGSEPVLGSCSTVPTAVDFEAWDDTNTLRISIRTSGSFSSVTDASLLAGANAALWGRQGRWELVQFGTATQINATTWDLSHLLRGRRGTNWATDLHTSGDWFILLDSASVARHVLSTADIGNPWYYRAPRSNEAVTDARVRTWTVGDEPLQPYTPIEPAASFTGNDATLTWTGRTIRSGAYGGPNGLTDGVGGASSRSWVVSIRDASAAVINTYPFDGAASFSYPEASIIADHGGYPPQFYWDVAEVSDTVGSGRSSQTLQTWTPTGSSYVSAILADGASHLWRLNDSGVTASDYVASLDGGYNGSYTQGQPSLLADASGSAVQWSGGYLEVPADADIQSTKTVEILLNPDALPGSSGAALAACHNPSGSKSGFTLVLLSDGGLFIQIQDGTGPVLNLSVAATTTVGTVVHVAVQWDGFTTADEVRLVVNGVVAASGYPSADWSIGSWPLRAAKAADTYWESLAGDQQEIAIYPIAVPVADLLNHAQLAGTAPP